MQISIGISVKGSRTSAPLGVPFTSTWTTTGLSQTIELPYLSTGGTYSGTIDWGDGNTSANSYTNRTHTYATAGTYTVVINGTCIGWNFSVLGESNYITSVVNWGNLQFGTNNGGYFSLCSNLDLSSVQGILNLTGITNMSNMFTECFSLTSINNINSWNTSAVTNMSGMFASCTSFNQPLSFNTAAVTDMSVMFSSCISFNQPLSFNTAAVTDMSGMFASCTSFNKNIGSWDVANVTNFFNFMDGITFATFSPTNLDAIYNGWSASGVKPNISISFGTIRYTSAGAVAKAALIAPPNNWIILDGGLLP
jgi:surface protein